MTNTTNTKTEPTVKDFIGAINAIQYIAESLIPDLDGSYPDHDQVTTDFGKRFFHRHDLTKSDYADLILDIALLTHEFHRRRPAFRLEPNDELPITF